MKKQYLLLMVLSSIMMMIFVVVNIQLRDEGSIKYLEFMKQLSLNITTMSSNSTDCVIPSFDVVFKDLKYRDIFHKKSPYPCLQSQPPLTYFEAGTFRWNRTSLASLTVPLSCQVRFIARKEGSDEELVISEKFSVKVGEDRKYGGSLVHVTCNNVKSGVPQGIFYQNIHFNIMARKHSVKNSGHAKTSSDNANSQPRSIFLFLIESLSRVNAHVQLPKTLQVLKNQYNSTFLHGMMKVGDNTFPNVLALTTGLWAGERGGAGSETGPFKPPGAPDSKLDIDSLPFIWKDARQAGCPTFYSEDSPSIGTFNYYKAGFRDPPTDVYHRPFWLAASRLARTKVRDVCLLGRPSFSYQLELARQFLQLYRHNCSFSFLFHVEFGHTQDINDISAVDSEVSAFLSSSLAAGLMEDKLVVVGGDHGNRFSWSRTSLGGRFEERMPFMSVSLPHRIRSEFPAWQINLNNNRDKLLSHFDIHVTMSRYLSQSGDNTSTTSTMRSPISLLESTAAHNRTCAEAGVPEYYCVCIPETYLPTRSPLIYKATKNLLRRINSLVRGYSDLCHRQQLKTIHEARRLQNSSRRLRLVVSTNTGAVYEALLSSDGAEVVGDINRLDWAGSSVDCVRQDYLQLFCHCKPQVQQSETLQQDLFSNT